MAASRQTIYLTSDKRTVVTAFEMYEFHGKASLGFRYLDEFANKSTFQGYALHIFGALTF